MQLYGGLESARPGSEVVVCAGWQRCAGCSLIAVDTGAAARVPAVRDLQGRSIVLDVDAEGSVGSIRTALRLRTGLPIEELVLTTCSGALLADDARSLAEHGIGAEASLQLGGRLLGGGGKKKAKIMPKVQPLEKHKLPSAFLCIFCDHKSIAVKMCVPCASVDRSFLLTPRLVAMQRQEEEDRDASLQYLQRKVPVRDSFTRTPSGRVREVDR